MLSNQWNYFTDQSNNIINRRRDILCIAPISYAALNRINFVEDKLLYVISLKNSSNSVMSVWVWKCICHVIKFNTHVSISTYGDRNFNTNEPRLRLWKLSVQCILHKKLLNSLHYYHSFTILSTGERNIYGTQLMWLNWMCLQLYNRLCLAWRHLNFGVNDVEHPPKLDRVLTEAYLKSKYCEISFANNSFLMCTPV